MLRHPQARRSSYLGVPDTPIALSIICCLADMEYLILDLLIEKINDIN